jgi:UDP-glucose 4-epimerase
MNILLTGGAGYIGSHTAVVLIGAGFNVVLLDNLSNSQRDIEDRLEIITSKKITFIEGDVRDKSLVSSVMKTHKIDAVIHLAGLKAVGESVLDPLRYFDNNVGGTISLLEAMQKNDIKIIVFSSSATVYGEPQYLPIDELHPTCAINPYGRTKLHIEQILQDLCLSDTSWRVLCLRYFNPVGAHESGLIGDDSNGIPSNLVPFVSGVAAKKYPLVKIFGNDYSTLDGTGVRDYIHVVDLARGHLSALNYLNRHYGFDVFNLGTEVGYSVLEIIKNFESVSGVIIPFEISQRRNGDVASCYANTKKANNILGWKPMLKLEDMIASTWNFEKKVKKC